MAGTVDKGKLSYYFSSMKVKTSITLSRELLAAVDRRSAGNRSEFIERALRAYIAGLAKMERAARDIKIINDRADALNAEAGDVLDYQGKI